MQKTKMTVSKVLAIGAGMLGAMAPQAANSPTAPNGGTVISQTQVPGSQGMQAQTQVPMAGASQGIAPGRGHQPRYSRMSTIFTAPRYNQRKARRDARRVNKAVKR